MQHQYVFLDFFHVVVDLVFEYSGFRQHDLEKYLPYFGTKFQI
jgi:hypothetical protein